jgi:hypothetical protein
VKSSVTYAVTHKAKEPNLCNLLESEDEAELLSLTLDTDEDPNFLYFNA